MHLKYINHNYKFNQHNKVCITLTYHKIIKTMYFICRQIAHIGTYGTYLTYVDILNGTFGHIGHISYVHMSTYFMHEYVDTNCRLSVKIISIDQPNISFFNQNLLSMLACLKNRRAKQPKIEPHRTFLIYSQDDQNTTFFYV